MNESNLYITRVARGLVTGGRCLITGAEFVSTKVEGFDECWRQAVNHCRSVTVAQDTIDGVHTPRNLSLPDRQNLYRLSQA